MDSASVRARTTGSGLVILHEGAEAQRQSGPGPRVDTGAGAWTMSLAFYQTRTGTVWPVGQIRPRDTALYFFSPLAL